MSQYTILTDVFHLNHPDHNHPDHNHPDHNHPDHNHCKSLKTTDNVKIVHSDFEHEIKDLLSYNAIISDGIKRRLLVATRF